MLVKIILHNWTNFYKNTLICSDENEDDNIAHKDAPNQDDDTSQTSVNGLDSSKNGETNKNTHNKSENGVSTGMCCIFSAFYRPF